MVKIVNDILEHIDKGSVVALVSLDICPRYRMRMSGVPGEISLMTALLRAGVVNEVITRERHVSRGVTR